MYFTPEALPRGSSMGFSLCGFSWVFVGFGRFWFASFVTHRNDVRGIKNQDPEKSKQAKACSTGMWNNILTWLERHARSRYVRVMGEEMARLRAEKPPPVNSSLGTPGFPP